MSFPFSRAIVTGASSGIGRSLSLELARAGVSQVVVARRIGPLRELAQEIEKLGAHAHVLVGDITRPEIRQQAIELAQSQLGGLDLLVNNAGISVQGEFLTGTPDQLRAVFELNFFAAVELTRLALPLLLVEPRACVANISSILGHVGIPFNSEYCASKFALRGWSDSLRAELSGSRVQVLVVSPGTTSTNFCENLIERRRDMPWDQSHSVSPEYVARATVQSLRRGRSETTPNPAGWWMLLANRLAPAILRHRLGQLGRRPR